MDSSSCSWRNVHDSTIAIFGSTYPTLAEWRPMAKGPHFPGRRREFPKAARGSVCCGREVNGYRPNTPRAPPPLDDYLSDLDLLHQGCGARISSESASLQCSSTCFRLQRPNSSTHRSAHYFLRPSSCLPGIQASTRLKMIRTSTTLCLHRPRAHHNSCTVNTTSTR